jgi:hypothetical protein
MAETLKSAPITNYDATPVVAATTGEGTQGEMSVASDSVACTASAAAFSTYRLCRFPTTAKVKHVWAMLSGLEAAATTGAALMDFNVAFSDSTRDGTQVALQGAIPSNKKDGTAFVIGATAYSTAYTNTGTGNKMFGSSIAATSSASQVLELTFKNTFLAPNRDDDLWDVFGFVNAQGTAKDPGGFFDILAVFNTAPTTANAGTIAIEVDYVV